MTHSNRNLVRPAACASIAAALLMTFGASMNAVQTTARTVYVSVLDKAGEPVKDMTAADLEVKENGKVQEIKVEPSTVPMRVALIVADGGLGVYQGAAGAFMDKLNGKAEFKLVDAAEQPKTLTEYTSDVQKLAPAVGTLTRRAAGRRPGQLMEAIMAAAKDVAAEGKRGVIVVMRVGGEATSTMQSSIVRDAIRKGGIRLHVISPQGGGGMAMNKTTTNTDDQRANQESADQLAQLYQVIEDGAKESGGRNDPYSATTLAKTVQALGDELASSYQVTYTLPAGVKPSDKLQVSTKRKDVKVYAPTRIAN